MMKPVIRGAGTLSVVIALLTSACGGSVASTPTPSAGRTLLAAPSPEATLTPPPSPPTATPEPDATATPALTGDSGIDGIVLAGPTCPVERIDSPCPDRPVATTIAVFSGTSETDAVVQIVTGEDGRFQQPLDPGTYTLRGACIPGMTVCSPYPRIVPQTVAVGNGIYTAVTIHADTGIR